MKSDDHTLGVWLHPVAGDHRLCSLCVVVISTIRPLAQIVIGNANKRSLFGHVVNKIFPDHYFVIGKWEYKPLLYVLRRHGVMHHDHSARKNVIAKICLKSTCLKSDQYFKIKITLSAE